MNAPSTKTAITLLLGALLLSGCATTGGVSGDDPEINSLKQQVAANPGDLQTRGKLVDSYIEHYKDTRDPAYRDAAIAELRTLTAQHPNHTGANLALYQLLLGLSLEKHSKQDLEELRGIYRRTAVLKETPIAPPSLIEGVIELQGVQHDKQLPSVIHTVRGALKENPRHVGTRLLLAKLYGELGQGALAMAMLEQAYQLEPDRPAVLRAYGMRLYDGLRATRCQGDTRHLDQTLSIVKKAAAKFPKDPELQFELAELYEMRQMHELALYTAKRRYEIQSNADTGTFLAELYAGAGHFPESIELYQELIQKHPDDAELLNSLAHVYFQDMQWQQANATFLKYLEKTADADPYAMIWLSLSDQMLKDPLAARRHLRAIRESSLSNDWERALRDFHLGELDEAQLLARADSTCEQVEAYYYTGFQKWLHNDRAGARTAFQKVLALNVPYFYEHTSAGRLLDTLKAATAQ